MSSAGARIGSVRVLEGHGRLTIDGEGESQVVDYRVQQRWRGSRPSETVGWLLGPPAALVRRLAEAPLARLRLEEGTELLVQFTAVVGVFVGMEGTPA